jgi:Pyruvate/2-oxoacid:ferredoxin oxidoreductase delta subunit
MSRDAYRELLEVMKKRGGPYAGKDIPEFFAMVEELFTPEEAAVNNAMPKGPFTAESMSEGTSLNTAGGVGFICNCDRWHCDPVKRVLATSKPGVFLNSGFQPVFGADTCTSCEICIDRCPPEALSMGDDDLPTVNLHRCFGCAVCGTGCPDEAIQMVNKPGFPGVPKDPKALKEAQAGG